MTSIPSTRRAAAWLTVVASLTASACERDHANPTANTHALPSSAAVRVGTYEISAEAVARIATAQNIPIEAARDRAVRDALFASQAGALAMDRRASVKLALETALARRLLRNLSHEAVKNGPVTDAELTAVTAKHWIDLDRPESFRTLHAVVRVDAKADDAKHAAAEAVARAFRGAFDTATKIARETANAKDVREGDEATLAAAKLGAATVPHGGFEVVVEALAPVAADGRVVAQEGGAYDENYARGAASLHRRGDLSDLVKSSFGYHVILLLGREPGFTVPAEERRVAVRAEVLSERAATIHTHTYMQSTAKKRKGTGLVLALKSLRNHVQLSN